MKGLCSISGCDKPAFCRGYCSGHYHRWQRHNGDPLGGRPTTERSEVAAWLDAHISYQGDDCLTWPFGLSDNGYPVAYLDEGKRYAHRVMCERAHGAPPSRAQRYTAHSCGNGHLGCVNPNHLRWDTQKGNLADRVTHGTDARGEKCATAKLTEALVYEIRELQGRMTQQQLADLYGVTQTAISLIQRRERWSHLPELPT